MRHIRLASEVCISSTKAQKYLIESMPLHPPFVLAAVFVLNPSVQVVL